jgi:hypothetical protein
MAAGTAASLVPHSPAGGQDSSGRVQSTAMAQHKVLTGQHFSATVLLLC